MGEHVPSGGLGVVRILAFAAVTAGAVVLAQPEEPRTVATRDLEDTAAQAVSNERQGLDD